jgi:hypothetical protein
MFNVFVWALWVLVNPYKPALLWFRQAETNVVILSYRLSTHDSSVWISIEATEFWGTSHFRWIHKKKSVLPVGFISNCVCTCISSSSLLLLF